jgi:hypothetical protein
MMKQTGRVSAVRVILGLLVVIGVLLFIGSIGYEHVPESRRAGSELWFSSGDWRSHVEEYAKKTSRLEGSGMGLTSPVANDTQFGRVEMSIDANGRIQLRNSRFNLEAVMTPSVRDGAVHWDCKGTPPKDMSQWCR